MNDEIRREFLSTDLSEGAIMSEIGINTLTIFATVSDESKAEQIKNESSEYTYFTDKGPLLKVSNAANCFDYSTNPILTYSDVCEVRRHESFLPQYKRLSILLH